MKGVQKMNAKELTVELIRHGLSIPEAANRIGIGKKAFYSKLRGESQFKLCEIQRLKELLSLSMERTSEIFFC